MSTRIYLLTPSGWGVLARISQGKGPGLGMANATNKLIREGYLSRRSDGRLVLTDKGQRALESRS